MSKQTLKEKAQAILTEKESKIIAGNIKKDIQIFDVTGSLESLDTSDATATANDLVANTTAYVDGVKITGTLRDERSDCSFSRFNNITVHQGVNAIFMNGNITNDPYGSGEGVVFDKGAILSMSVSFNDMATAIGLTADKIKAGETVLGIIGTYTGN